MPAETAVKAAGPEGYRLGSAGIAIAAQVRRQSQPASPKNGITFSAKVRMDRMTTSCGTVPICMDQDELVDTAISKTSDALARRLRIADDRVERATARGTAAHGAGENAAQCRGTHQHLPEARHAGRGPKAREHPVYARPAARGSGRLLEVDAEADITAMIRPRQRAHRLHRQVVEKALVDEIGAVVVFRSAKNSQGNRPRWPCDRKPGHSPCPNAPRHEHPTHGLREQIDGHRRAWTGPAAELISAAGQRDAGQAAHCGCHHDRLCFFKAKSMLLRTSSGSRFGRACPVQLG